MPTYSYRCTECAHAFDQHQAFTEDSLTVCPACAKPTLRKVFNSIGVTFSGSGFYRTDSRTEAGGGSTSSLPAKKTPSGSSGGGSGSGSNSNGSSSSGSSGSGSSSGGSTGSGSGGSGGGSGAAKPASAPASS